MRRLDVPLEILYELAMSIGNSTDLNENIQEALSTYLQKLHCFAGAVFVPAPPGSPEPAILVKSIPRQSTLSRNEGYRAAMAYPGWSAGGLPSKGSAGLDYHYHWFDLPEYGWLLLLRTHQPLSNGLQSALLEINSKLAISARSCSTTALHLKESRQLLRNVLDTIPARVFWKDNDLRFVGCNIAFARDKGLASAAEIAGCDDRSFSPSPYSEKYRADDRRVLATGEPLRDYEEQQTRPDGTERWLRTSKVPLRDEWGAVIGLLGVYEDVTEEKRSEEQIRRQLKEREALLAEIHHRVFNSLSVISGLLSLQASRAAETGDQRSNVDRAFRATRMRIDTMAMIYRSLYRAGEYVDVDMAVCLRDLANHLSHDYPAARRVVITIEEDTASLPLEKAIPCALIANELLSNALRYAFPGERSGTIVISLRLESEFPGGDGEEKISFSVVDDGIALPAGTDPERTESLGFYLVRVLAKQLRGFFTVDILEESKTFCVTFPP